MESGAPLLLYALLFIGVLLVVEGAYRLVDSRRGPNEAINRRLRLLASGTAPEDVLKLLRRPVVKDGLANLPVVNRLPMLLVQAGLRWPARSVLGGMVALTLGTMLGLNLVAPLLFALVFGLTAGVVVPLILLTKLRRRRLNEMSRQLPDALDLIVRSLRAGHPLNAALAAVAREMPDPMGSEAGIVVDEIVYGMALADAVESMAQRVGLEDVQYFVVAIKLQHGTGGNLADILCSLSRVVRGTLAMTRRIRAISAEGRISGLVLSATPPALAGIITLIAPSFFGDVIDDPLFMPMIYLIIILTALNYFVTRRLVNFHV